MNGLLLLAVEIHCAVANMNSSGAVFADKHEACMARARNCAVEAKVYDAKEPRATEIVWNCLVPPPRGAK